MAGINHKKTDNIPAPSQSDLDAQIALGNYPPGTKLADIVLSTDWNAGHSSGSAANGTVATADGAGGINFVSPASPTTINGLITSGTNTTLSGSGTSASPYAVNVPTPVTPTIQQVTDAGNVTTDDVTVNNITTTGNATINGGTLTLGNYSNINVLFNYGVYDTVSFNGSVYHDFQWQGGYGVALQMGAYHEIRFTGGATGQTPSFTGGSSGRWNVVIENTNTSSIGLTVKGASGQTGDLQQWTDVNYNVLSRVTSSGAIIAGSAADNGLAKLQVNGNASISGFIYDSNNSTGNGQVLSGTATGTAWTTDYTAKTTPGTQGQILTSTGTGSIWGYAPVYNFANYFSTSSGADCTTAMQNFLLFCQLQAMALKSNSLDDQIQRAWVTAYIPRGYYTLTSPLIVPELVNIKCDGILVRNGAAGTITNNYTGDTTTKALVNLQQPCVIVVPRGHAESLNIYGNNDGVHLGSGLLVGKNWTASAVSIGAAGTGYAVGNVLTLAQPSKAPYIATTVTVTSIGTGGTVTGVSLTTPGAYSLPPVLQTQQWTAANGFNVFASGSNFITTGGAGTGATISITWKTDWSTATGVSYQPGQGGLIGDTVLGHIRLTGIGTVQDATYGPTFGMRFYGLNYIVDEIELTGGRSGIDFTYASDIHINKVNTVNAYNCMIFYQSSSVVCANCVIDTPLGYVALIDTSQGIKLSGRAFNRNVSNNPNTSTNYPIQIGQYSAGLNLNTGITLNFEMTNCGSGGTGTYALGCPALYMAYCQAYDINLLCNNQSPGRTGLQSLINSYAVFGTGNTGSGRLRGSIDGVLAGTNPFSGTIPNCGIELYDSVAGGYITQGGLYLLQGSGAPVSGTSGTGVNKALIGSYYTDITNGMEYINQAAAASPSWVAISTRNGSISTVSSNTTLTANSGTVLINAASGPVTITLPAASATTGQIGIYKKIDSTSNLVTIAGTIDGATNYTTTVPNDFVSLQSNGTSYYVVG